jgi:hypothetical protein
MKSKTLKNWGMVFVVAGIIGRSFLQNGLLGVGTVTGTELMQNMQESSGTMIIATVALVLEALETCAVPIFAFTLVEGFLHTEDSMRYLMRLGALALLSEIPYNLAMSNRLFDMNSRNPVFGLALGLLMLYLFRFLGAKKTPCIIAALAAFVWIFMLKVEHGIPMILMIIVLWIFRKNRMTQGFAGAAAAALCTLGSIFYLFAPMGFLVTHRYSGERGDYNRVVSYLLYPVALLAVGLATKYLI